MGERRLASIGLLMAGLVCAAALVGGCAQSVGERADGKGAGGKEDADSLVARSAAGLERVLSGEQGKGKQMAKAPNEGAEAGGGDSAGRGAVDGALVGKPPDDGARSVANAANSNSNSCSAPVAGPIAGTASNSSGSGGSGAGDGGAALRAGGVLSGWWGVATVEEAGEKGAAPVAVPAARGAQYWKAEEGAGESASLRISALALCTRVEGFGRFNKVESVRATGKPVPLLVYTQVDGFSYKGRDGSTRAGVGDGSGGAGVGGDAPSEWVIELGQSVVVYRMGADGKSDVQVKVEPEQVARDVAAFKRRDHFLVQRIELPTPLVAGKYVVKVSVRDKGTGMVDERTAEVVVR